MKKCLLITFYLLLSTCFVSCITTGKTHKVDINYINDETVYEVTKDTVVGVYLFKDNRFADRPNLNKQFVGVLKSDGDSFITESELAFELTKAVIDKLNKYGYRVVKLYLPQGQPKEELAPDVYIQGVLNQFISTGETMILGYKFDALINYQINIYNFKNNEVLWKDQVETTVSNIGVYARRKTNQQKVLNQVIVKSVKELFEVKGLGEKLERLMQN